MFNVISSTHIGNQSSVGVITLKLPSAITSDNLGLIFYTSGLREPSYPVLFSSKRNSQCEQLQENVSCQRNFLRNEFMEFKLRQESATVQGEIVLYTTGWQETRAVYTEMLKEFNCFTIKASCSFRRGKHLMWNSSSSSTHSSWRRTQVCRWMKLTLVHRTSVDTQWWRERWPQTLDMTEIK